MSDGQDSRNRSRLPMSEGRIAEIGQGYLCLRDRIAEIGQGYLCLRAG
jgi:hypothetical protein